MPTAPGLALRAPTRVGPAPASRTVTFGATMPGRRDESSLLPWPLFVACLWLSNLFQGLANWLRPPALRVMELAFGFGFSQVVYVVAKLDVADALASGPMTIQELARHLECHEASLLRVLRTAVNMHILDVSPDDPVRFKNTALSLMLRSNDPNSLKWMIRHLVEDSYVPWGELEYGVRTGKVPFEKAHGQDIWQWLKERPDSEDIFSKAMISADRVFGMQGALEDYPWRQFTRFVDIGGAYGSFLMALLDRHPGATGVLFDQPQVIKRAKEKAAAASNRKAWSRVEFCGGDFLNAETIPKGQDGDAFVLRVVLHDWRDEDAARIMSNLRVAIGRAAVRVLIVELSLLHEYKEPFIIREIMDLHMLVEQGGAERTAAQWHTLLAGARFRVARIVECRGPMSVIEAEPI